MSNYTLLKANGRARLGEFNTVHGKVKTPAFMNVATAAAIKGGVSAIDLNNEVRCQVMLSNTYHLHLRPGDKLIHDLGGLGTLTLCVVLTQPPNAVTRSRREYHYCICVSLPVGMPNLHKRNKFLYKIHR